MVAYGFGRQSDYSDNVLETIFQTKTQRYDVKHVGLDYVFTTVFSLRDFRDHIVDQDFILNLAILMVV